MNGASSSTRAAELRQAFDRSFAEPIATEMAATADFLAVQLGGDPYAIAMSEIAGLFSDIRVTSVPGPLPELCGVAGFRGAVTPVYDLAALLGYPPAPGRWIVLSASRDLAFSFDDFNDHFRTEAAAVAVPREGSGRHVRGIAQLGSSSWQVIDIPSLIGAIRSRLPDTNRSKE